MIRNWIFDNIPDEVLLVVDDDMRAVSSKVGLAYRKYTDPADVRQICENAAYCAREVGAKMFGFSHVANIIYEFKPQDPISFEHWIGGIVGFIGRGIRYDERYMVAADNLDISLQHLQKNRIVYVDARFYFLTSDTLRAHGGLGKDRSQAREQADADLLVEKWGRYVTVGFKDSERGRVFAGADGMGKRYKSIHIPRRQSKL